MSGIALRILGIDPGLRLTGFGVIEAIEGKLTYVASGTIKTTNGRGDDLEDLPSRIKTIVDGLFEVIGTYQPLQVAVEKVFVNVNPQSTLLLGQARGAAISAAVIRELPVAEYTALQVKQAVVGNGHAAKEQVQEMVKRLLNLPAVPKPDSADALACAICHAHGGQGLGRLATAGFRVRGGRLV
ncbi:MAG TPA: crossover junction endodeoxyribonuclease RuvC [Methylophilaceae bacterium]|nr:crossover junction endodeoxyribonuclease RuvC [Methylophilaceae bacterium]